MLPYYDEYANASGESNVDSGAYVLNANVFVTDTDICSVKEDYSYSEFYAFCNNTLGNDCYGNTFGNACNSNTFGNKCYGNTFGDGCYNNTFGNNCGNNTFGNYIQESQFGDGVQSFSITTQHMTTKPTASNIKSYIRRLIVENGVRYVNVYVTTSTSSSSYCQNVRICQGCSGINNRTYKSFAINNVGGSRQLIVCYDTSGTLRTGNIGNLLAKL